MRFMVIVKASKDSEAGVMPSQQLLGAEFTPALKGQEKRLRNEMTAKHD